MRFNVSKISSVTSSGKFFASFSDFKNCSSCAVFSFQSSDVNERSNFLYSTIARIFPDTACFTSCLLIATNAGIVLRFPFSMIGTGISVAAKKSSRFCCAEIWRACLRGRPLKLPQPIYRPRSSRVICELAMGGMEQGHKRKCVTLQVFQIFAMQRFRPIRRHAINYTLLSGSRHHVGFTEPHPDLA